MARVPLGDSLLGTPSPSHGWGMSQLPTVGHFWLSTSIREGSMLGPSLRSPEALQQFGRGEGEIEELLLVDGREERLVDGREGGLFLGEVRVKVVHVFRCFLSTTGRKREGSE